MQKNKKKEIETKEPLNFHKLWNKIQKKKQNIKLNRIKAEKAS